MGLRRPRGAADGGEEAGEDVEGYAAAGELLEQEDAGDGEDDVGAPDAEERGELALVGEGDADGGEEVVDEDEEDGDDEAGGLASALGA